MTTWRDSITVHPLADSFPMMLDGELQELAADIKKNGQREPVVFVEIDGERTLIDGRNRLAACAMVGVKPWTTTATELNDDAATRAFIISHNVHRRHLTPEERLKRLEAAIIANPTASARAIAEEAGVDKNKVVKARKKLESTGAVRTVQKTVGKDGKARTTTPKPKKPTEPQGALDAGINGVAAEPAEIGAEQRKAENAAAEAAGSKQALKKFMQACDLWLKEMDAEGLAAAVVHFTAVRAKLI
jgi:ParB-like chromosome segregation protein Spo0J